VTTQVAAISEIFSSLQGEGTHMGERHLFVRFEVCNIHCDYCDELGKTGHDYDLAEALSEIRKLQTESGPHAFVSLTGGEPLVYLPYLRGLVPQLKGEGFKIYLETGGILWKALEEIISLVDVVAMDVKPASVTKEKSFLEEHRKFLAISLKTEVFLKMVCSKDIDLGEYRELCDMIGSVSQETPLLLQPISSEQEGHDDPELMRLLHELQTIGLGRLRDVRIVPRLHKILNIR
jgi:7-carboxy-7-deazaguanine synthase